MNFLWIYLKQKRKKEVSSIQILTHQKEMDGNHLVLVK